MSLTEPSKDIDQEESEIRLQDDVEINECDPEDQKDKDMRMKDVVQINQRDKRLISPLNLLKEDFSQLKEEVLKVFKDKDLKLDNCPSSQGENKPACSALDLLKDDFSQFKEDVTSVFGISSSKDKETKSAEKMVNRLSFLKEDLSHFKDDLSSVFRIGISKERNAAKEDSSNTFKIKGLKDERTDEPFKSLFRRDQKTPHKAENSLGAAMPFSEASEEQMDGGFRGSLSEQKDETVNTDKMNNMKDQRNELQERELGLTDCGEKSEMINLSETPESEERILSSQTAEQRCESEERSDASVMTAEDEKEEEKQPESLSSSLPAGVSLFSLTHPNKDDTRDQSGDKLWSVKNFAYYLTFDPNTANSELRLTDCNRKATRVWSDQQLSHHPERFERCPQVLCREGLLDSVYWEVVWSGGADIGVTYNSISRDGDMASCLLGHNQLSWSLECSEGSYTPCHRNKRLSSSSPQPFTHRVGVYLNWSAGSLSFYCVSQDTIVHLHTFTSTFTEPLYPAFWVWAYDGSVSLCHVELDWERLL